MMRTSRMWRLALLVLLWCPLAAAQRPNIVLISVDGLRMDRTHFGGNPRHTTPNLDALVKDGVLFTEAFSQSNESLFSHASIFTGRYPWELGSPDYIRYVVPQDVQTIPEVLRLAGYQTASFQAGGHIGAEFGFKQGFDHHEQADNFASFFDTVPMANRWLEARQTKPEESQAPFFLFLHGYDCHRPYGKSSVFFHPFDQNYQGPVDRIVNKRNKTENIFDGVLYKAPPANRIQHKNGTLMLDPAWYLKLADMAKKGELKQRGILQERDISHLVAHYDASVLSADTYVGIFLQKLGELGLWENTIVVVLSDHGEDLQQHGFTNHRAVLFDSTTKVPMIISGGALPEQWRGTTRSDVTDAVDVFATLAEIAGTVAPAQAQGRSLWAMLGGQVDASEKLVFQQGVLGHLSVRSSTHRLVFLGPGPLDPDFAKILLNAPLDSQVFSLFDTRTDPGEHTDIKSEQPEVLAKLVSEMRTWFKGLKRSNKTTNLSPEQLEMLRSRGYW